MAVHKPETVDRARSLRRSETAAEQKLWESLRNRRLNGLKFVRQLPIGPYFGDFVCREKMLVIEIDGATHSAAAEVEHDRKRSEFLAAKRFKIHRCWNEDVFKNIDGVLDSILLAAAK